ncbi:hypothetical protein HRH59_13420 [Rheinheimera sp. YQF-2]|uniref:Tetratricopeptide repeat protein n=1 Tax=Rheinheimera lutimaris TaxID=2740584 RepID=A0A7Y5EJ95_9GAMM|nr:hypothetical protein [Rheinheimera lutimaris]NRQ43547.1 hypothetical protein [Rheinheimera lutimaris]
MDAIEHWKHIIRQANSAFAHDHYALAADLYRQATFMLAQSWPQHEAQLARATVPRGEDGTALLIICLSISVQNLAQTYARQQRWRRCLSTLNRALQQVIQLQQQIPPAHPANIALLRESCNLRRELCRFSQLAAPALQDKIFCHALPVSHALH